MVKNKLRNLKRNYCIIDLYTQQNFTCYKVKRVGTNFIALSICSSDKNLLLFVIDQMCSHKLNVNWTDLLLWLWQDGYVLYAYDKIEFISDFLVLFRIDVYMQSMYA